MNSKTLNVMYEYLDKLAKYCPAWVEYTGKGADRKTKQLEAIASPLYDKYHVKIKDSAHSFKGSVVLIGSTGLALHYMAIELGEYMARVEYLQKYATPIAKQNQELYAWYKDLCTFKTKYLEELFVDDFKQWKRTFNFEQELKDVMVQLRSQKEICLNSLINGSFN